MVIHKPREILTPKALAAAALISSVCFRSTMYMDMDGHIPGHLVTDTVKKYTPPDAAEIDVVNIEAGMYYLVVKYILCIGWQFQIVCDVKGRTVQAELYDCIQQKSK
ncbi:hypothetical protein ACOMHN_006081 [Nucella lapillus]